MPWAMFCAIAMSRWNRTSSSRSRSIAFGATRLRSACAMRRRMDGIVRSESLEHELDRAGEPAPALELRSQCASARGGQPIVLRPAVVLGDVPLTVDPPLELEPLERGVERSLANLEDLLR